MDYLTYADIERITGLRANTLRQRVWRGTFPPPDYQPNANTPLWKPTTVEKWNRQRFRELETKVQRLKKQRDQIDAQLERLNGGN